MRMNKYVVMIFLCLLGSVVLCSCGSEDVYIEQKDDALPNAEDKYILEGTIEDTKVLCAEFNDEGEIQESKTQSFEKVDVLSERDVTYIPEDIYANKKAVIEDSDGLVYWTYENGTAILFNSNADSTSITIAEEIKGCEVVGINSSVFSESDIEEIIIPDTIRYIGEKAFYSCDKLEKIHWGKGLLEVGEEAFYGLNISEVILPEGLEIIGVNAFSEATIKSLDIPDTVLLIRMGAFSDCAQLTDIRIGTCVCRIDNGAFSATPWLESQTDEFVIVGDGVLLKYNGTNSHVEVPEGIKSLSSVFDNFDCGNIIEIKLPNTLIAIGDLAFWGCRDLEKLIIPENVKYVGTGVLTTDSKVFLPRDIEYVDTWAFLNDSSAVFYFEGDEDEWMTMIGEDKTRQRIMNNLSVIYNVDKEDMLELE